jgi:transcriptional regulator with XRE-family HTH domain
MTKPQTLRTLIGSMTQKAFAEKHGIRSEIISKWLSGQRNICNEKLQEIANKEGYKLTIEFKLEKL